MSTSLSMHLVYFCLKVLCLYTKNEALSLFIEYLTLEYIYDTMYTDEGNFIQ
mgnify:CR=1 FL=1